MIPRLEHRSVCVIDDEEQDYKPILAALSRLGLAYVHVRGINGNRLRSRPSKGFRLIFTDLHLGGHVGKAAASHTANVFKALVAPDTAPVIVVIWSKYADDLVGDAGLPPQDQPTEADQFKETLLEAVPSFKDRLVFCEMRKPKPRNRPKGVKWVTKLKEDIRKELNKVVAFDVLWTWESIVRDAGIGLTEILSTFALESASGATSPGTPPPSLHDKLKLALRVLVQEQGGPDCTPATAPRHLASVLAQILADHLEHSLDLKTLAKHGDWLSDVSGLPKVSPVAPGMNGLLLTAGLSKRSLPYNPGTVYQVSDPKRFKKLFGADPEELSTFCYNGPPTKLEEWKTTFKPKPVLVELSPACDVQHSNRRSALLIAGLILPAAAIKAIKRSDTIEVMPIFGLRWAAFDFAKQDAFLIFCSRYKATENPKREPRWLKSWFRLRELPTASLRNWHAGHSSRVGYMSLRTS